MEKNKLRNIVNKVVFSLIISIFLVILLFWAKEHMIKEPIQTLKVMKYDNNKTEVKTNNLEEVLINPGKGLILRDKFNGECDDITAINYCRIEWSTIEPEEGKYNWNVIDDKIEACKKRGKKFAFGIMNANSSSTKVYVTPRWVFEKGAEYYTSTNKGGVTQVIPKWTDSIFLREVDKFIKVLANKYDGNPNIAYIDIRSYGNWGEQHLIGIEGEEITAQQLQELYIFPYEKAFKNTFLVNAWGKSEYNEVYNKSIDRGISIRRDGIMKLYNGKPCFEYAYGKLPTIFEYYSTYENLKNEGLWKESKLLNYIDQWSPSYTEIYVDMYKENPTFCRMIANKIGYYFRFKEAKFTNIIKQGDTNNISLKFINEGVAPLYEDCTVYIGLLDQNYNLVKKYKTDIDPHTWMPNEEKIENINIKFDDIEAGKYIISLGLFLNVDDEQPTYLLGNSGKTDDRWYVFGELQIEEPNEKYDIMLQNDEYYINNINSYNIDISIENLHNDAEYQIERYINNNLVENINVNKGEKEYNNTFEFNFNEGIQNFRIIIKKNNEIVSNLEKTIYVYSTEENLMQVTNNILQKYTEFEQKFQTEISNIPGLQQKIDSLKQYIKQIESKTTESENIAKQKMKEHFELGNTILSAYQKGELNIEYVKLSSMLDLLNDIGNSYEDLVTVSAKTRNPNLSETKTIINDAEKNINNNADLEIIYPQKILKFSKDLYEKAEYINSLEEENEIKTGLIVSNDLHAKYLAQWSKEFTDIYIEDYIKNNPITEKYSTKEITNQDVTVTLNILPDTKITNNKNSNIYTFTQNGEFIFEYQRRGRNFTKTVKVENIDKIAPQIINIKNEAKYTESIIPKIEEENLEKVTLTKNEEEIEYILGKEIEEEGKYKLTVTDKAGNISEVNFEILKYQEDSYIIDKDKIRNIKNNTTKEYFTEKLNMPGKYKILHNKEELETEDIVSSGDILQLEDGKTYTLIVAGDINQDGKVTAYDLSMLRKTILNVKELNEVEKLAADVNCDNNKIGAKDYSSMKLIILGK